MILYIIRDLLIFLLTSMGGGGLGGTAVLVAFTNIGFLHLHHDGLFGVDLVSVIISIRHNGHL